MGKVPTYDDGLFSARKEYGHSGRVRGLLFRTVLPSCGQGSVQVKGDHRVCEGAAPSGVKGAGFASSDYVSTAMFEVERTPLYTNTWLHSSSPRVGVGLQPDPFASVAAGARVAAILPLPHLIRAAQGSRLHGQIAEVQGSAARIARLATV